MWDFSNHWVTNMPFQAMRPSKSQTSFLTDMISVDENDALNSALWLCPGNLELACLPKGEMLPKGNFPPPFFCLFFTGKFLPTLVQPGGIYLTSGDTSSKEKKRKINTSLSCPLEDRSVMLQLCHLITSNRQTTREQARLVRRGTWGKKRKNWAVGTREEGPEVKGPVTALLLKEK